MAFDSQGNLYAANIFNGTIEKFSPTGSDLGTFATGLNNPDALAFDSHGNLYVSSEGGSSIEKFSPTGQDLGAFATTAGSSTGLAFNASGDLFVVVETGPSFFIEQYSPTGQDLGQYSSTDAFSNGLAFDSAGNLYAATSYGGIEKIPPGGGSFGQFAATGSGAEFIAIRASSVPEPSSLVLLGLGAVAMAAGRSRKARRIA